jgi:hypothetical protein
VRRVPTYSTTPPPSALNRPKAAKEFWRFLLNGWMDVHFGWILVRVIILKKSDLKLQFICFE